ncbi:MAG: hypothetical protein DME88_05140 [Verrucomicrobia bacterium]|nr:MAG: hypothetical protein DME88_05140 [Verrucomicrobiota bacterium]
MRLPPTGNHGALRSPRRHIAARVPSLIVSGPFIAALRALGSGSAAAHGSISELILKTFAS